MLGPESFEGKGYRRLEGDSVTDLSIRVLRTGMSSPQEIVSASTGSFTVADRLINRGEGPAYNLHSFQGRRSTSAALDMGGEFELLAADRDTEYLAMVQDGPKYSICSINRVGQQRPDERPELAFVEMRGGALGTIGAGVMPIGGGKILALSTNEDEKQILVLCDTEGLAEWALPDSLIGASILGAAPTEYGAIVAMLPLDREAERLSAPDLFKRARRHSAVLLSFRGNQVPRILGRFHSSLWSQVSFSSDNSCAVLTQFANPADRPQSLQIEKMIITDGSGVILRSLTVDGATRASFVSLSPNGRTLAICTEISTKGPQRLRVFDLEANGASCILDLEPVGRLLSLKLIEDRVLIVGRRTDDFHQTVEPRAVIERITF